MEPPAARASASRSTYERPFTWITGTRPCWPFTMSVREVAAFCADTTTGKTRNTIAAAARIIERLATFGAWLAAYVVLVVNLFMCPHSFEDSKRLCQNLHHPKQPRRCIGSEWVRNVISRVPEFGSETIGLTDGELKVALSDYV